MKCNICGEEFSMTDFCNNFSISRKVAYGSMHDGEQVDLHICNKCFDRLVNVCVIDPFKR